jgi:hypothetical protein
MYAISVGPEQRWKPSAAKHFGGYDVPKSGVFQRTGNLSLEEINMNQRVALDAALLTSVPQRKGGGHLLALCFFVLVAAVLVIAALLSDSSLTPEQRIQVFQQSGMYP